MAVPRPADDAPTRARAWRDATHAQVCDVIEPWAHGTVVRATRLSSYYDFNVVRVERPPDMGVDALIEFAQQALSGLGHLKLDFDQVEVAVPLRAGFDERGWMTNPIIWMRHEAPLPPGPETVIEEVPYDEVIELRNAWHREDFPDVDPGDYPAQAREVALQRGARVFASVKDGTAVGFGEVERHGPGAEITSVYVGPEHRGRGLGTAITRAAIEAGAGATDLWIVADDEGRAKDLYAKLGFRGVWAAMEVLLPSRADGA